jgi:preprotein translocase subunit YajC
MRRRAPFRAKAEFTVQGDHWGMTTILAQAGGGFPASFFIQIAAFIAIFYFLFIRPQQKERKRHAELLAALKPGDQVVTMGGLVGQIVHLSDDLVTIKTGEARVVVQRARIASLAGAVSA